MESFAADLAEMRRTPLTETHVAALREVSEEVSLDKHHVMIKPGEPYDTFTYVLEGGIEVFDLKSGQTYLDAFLGPGQFMGEIAFLNGSAAALALRTREPSKVLQAPRGAVLALMAKIPEMSDIILSVLASRRRRQVEAGDGNLTLIGVEEDRAIRSVGSFLSRNKIPFAEVALDSPEAKDLCGGATRPGVCFGTEGLLDDPTPEAVARLLNLDQASRDGASVDVLIVGGGPGGVAAAVYAGAEGLSSMLVEELAVGGQAGTSSRIENYLGFPTGISGADLVWRGEIQAMKFGTQFVRPRRVVGVDAKDGRFAAMLSDGNCVNAGAIVVATGVQYRRLPWDRLADFEGAGVFYAATENEARYCKGEPVIVVGGGNSAGQAAMFLSRTASHVHLMIRGETLAASMSDYLSSRLEADPAITIHYRTQIEGLDGDTALTTARVNVDGAGENMHARGVFVMVGAAPNTSWLSDLVTLDPKGFIPTGDIVGGRSQYETSHPGIFAVGDVRSGSVKRVASAVGEGSVVISKVWEHVHDVADG